MKKVIRIAYLTLKWGMIMFVAFWMLAYVYQHIQNIFLQLLVFIGVTVGTWWGLDQIMGENPEDFLLK